MMMNKTDSVKAEDKEGTGNKTGVNYTKSSKASVTVEAALTLPLVLLALMLLTQPFFVMNTSRRMQTVCEDICKDVCTYLYSDGVTDSDSREDSGALIVDALSSVALGEYAKAKAEDSIPDAQVGNIKYSGTQFMLGDDIVTVQLSYNYKLPFVSIFGIDDIEQTVTASRRAWIGDRGSGNDSDGLEDDDEWVYIAKHGTRYHKTPDCRHISTEGMSSMTIEEAKANGRTACENCAKGTFAGATVYVFSGGKKYHMSSACKVDVPWVKKVRKSEVESMGACKTCYGR